MAYLKTLCIALVLALIAPAARAAVVYEKYVGAWMLGAYTNDETGQFSHCATSVPYRSGISLLFSIGANFRWRMGFVNVSWNLTAGDTYPIVYRVDNGSPITATARVQDKNFAVVDLLDSEALFSAFRRGYLLTVYAAGEVFYFDLKDSSRALAETLTCARTTTVAARTSNPFLANTAVSSNSRSSAESKATLKTEAAAVTANLLSSAGVSGFQLLDEVPKNLEIFHAMWIAPGLIGGVTVDGSASVEQALAVVTASATSQCKGRFASAKLPSSAGGASIKTVCEESSEKVDATSYTFLVRRKGGVYIFTTVEIDGEANGQSAAEHSAEATSGRLMDASIKILGAP